ncbi:response regulator transcription factor [Brevundimonas denitrificans]|uniref:response regulator transcription factor n=1 Tax=Brevundimonas denitrificans TaxID=1443434 RepID=UPI00223B81E9|nr:LuxR C-terminal-related transcriptional regulator [Brevundimonas denitrificans]
MDTPEWLSRLSPRERDVLAGVASGQSNKEIARDLEISARTVEVYRASLMTKAGVRTLSDLMRLALAAGY